MSQTPISISRSPRATHIIDCGSRPFGWSKKLSDTSTTAKILYQSCEKDPTNEYCKNVPKHGESGYVGLGHPAYESCGIFPQLDIPFLGKTLATKPVHEAVRDHTEYCEEFYDKHPTGHARTCDFVGITSRLGPHVTSSGPDFGDDITPPPPS